MVWRFLGALISIVKRCLKKTAGKAYLNFYELQMILSEIEIMINSRPLNTLYDDEMCKVMTPNVGAYRGGGEGSMGAVDPLFKKRALFEKKSNDIILYISSLRTSHVYTCLNFTYSA